MARVQYVQYMTVAPVTRRGKWQICSRRIGSRDRLMPIAECTSETIADRIVDALNGVAAVVLAEAAE